MIVAGRAILGSLGALYRRVRRWLPWTVVRVFGSLTYFNISYGVLLLVPILHELYVRAVPFMVYFGAPGDFPVTLQWLYGASLCYAFAILLYQVCCPDEVKGAATWEEYVQSQFETFQRLDPQHRIKIVLARLHKPSDAAWREEIEILHRKSINAETASERATALSQLDELLAKMHGHAVQEFLREHYQTQDISWLPVRWLSFAAYIAGCLILIGLLIVRSIGVFTDHKEGRVVITTSLEDGVLLLRAYSFQEREFDTLEGVLARADVHTGYKQISPDRYEREGRQYSVPKGSIERFGVLVSGTFHSQTGQFVPASGGGHPSYACKEKKPGGHDGRGCENLVAQDDSAAMVACNMIAGQRGWYFGEAEKGTCTGRRSRFW